MSELDFDKYSERLGYCGDRKNKDTITRLQDTLTRQFTRNASYFAVTITAADGVVRDGNAHIIRGVDGVNKIYMMPGELLTVGDVLYWEKGRGNHLCVFVNNNISVQYHGIIERCNQVITWQCPIDNKIHITPCILVDKTSVYSDGLSKTKLVSTGSDQKSISVQTNEYTDELKIDKRIMFKNDPNNMYRLSRVDNLLNEGITLFTAKKSLYNENTDRLDLNLPNYNGNQDTTRPDECDSDKSNVAVEDGTSVDIDALIINGKDSITVWDEAIPYTVDTDSDVVWTLDREDIITLDFDNTNPCKISPISRKKIGKTILTVTETSSRQRSAQKEIQLLYQ